MKKISLYLLCGLALTALTFCRNNKRSDSVDVAKESNENKALSNEDQSDFLVEVAGAGLAEVEMGKLAQDKAMHLRVKKFAKMMVADHTQINQEVKDLATKKQITLPGSISAEQQRDLTDLRKLGAKDFDQRYMQLMEDEHQRDISKFEEASENHKDSEIQAFAARTLPKLRAHLDSVKMIRSSFK